MTEAKDLSSTTTLANGVKMPWVGLGVFKTAAGQETVQAVRWALEIGYRHVDTAAFYGNEADVGRAVRESGIDRGQVFITTKVWNSDQGYESTLRAFDRSRKELDVDIVDLYLVHWPVPGKYTETWRALEKLLSGGKVRAIGVSNFLAHHLRDLAQHSSVKPVVNQVEFHPLLVQEDLLAYDAREGIQHEAWSPLARGRLLESSALVDIARRLGRTPAQVVLRWHLQKGVVIIPKSAKRERILENSSLFDFTLQPTDMRAISAMDNGTRIGPHPDNVTF